MIKTHKQTNSKYDFFYFLASGCNPDPCVNGDCVPNADGTFDRCNCNPGWNGPSCNEGKCLKYFYTLKI